jgi:hypothetical protein
MTSPKESSMKELQTINTQLKDLEKKIHEIDCSPDPCAFMTFAYEGMETGVAILKERREKIYKTYPDLRPTCDSDTEPQPKADLLADLLKVIIKDLGKTPYKEKAKKNKTLV